MLLHRMMLLMIIKEVNARYIINSTNYVENAQVEFTNIVGCQSILNHYSVLVCVQREYVPVYRRIVWVC